MSELSRIKGLRLRQRLSIFILLLLLTGCITVRISNEESHSKWLEVNSLSGVTEDAPIISLSTAIIPTRSQIISTATAAMTQLASPAVPSTKTATPAHTLGTPADASVCKDPIGCLKLNPNDPIHFAYLLDLVGASSSLGVDSLNAIEIAIDDSEGQILSHKIQLTGKDSGCNGDNALAAAKNLVTDPSIVAVLGPSCSGEARAAGPLLSGAGLVIISPSATAVDLTDPNNPSNVPGFFRTAISDEDHAATAADFVYNVLGVRTAATIDDGGSYSSTFQQIFSKQLTRLGGTITFHASITAGSTNMRETLAAIALDSPNLIYMPIFMPEAAYIIEQAKTITGLENTQLMGSEVLYSPDFSSVIGPAVDGFFVTYPAIQGPAYDAFLVKYAARFEKAPINIFHAQAYDAFNILKAAIEKVAIQEADGTLYIPRQALRNAIASTKDFPGVTGNLTCHLNGDCANPVVGVYEYHSNEFPPRLIWPKP